MCHVMLCSGMSWHALLCCCVRFAAQTRDGQGGSAARPEVKLLMRQLGPHFAQPKHGEVPCTNCNATKKLFEALAGATRGHFLEKQVVVGRDQRGPTGQSNRWQSNPQRRLDHAEGYPKAEKVPARLAAPRGHLQRDQAACLLRMSDAETEAPS